MGLTTYRRLIIGETPVVFKKVINEGIQIISNERHAKNNNRVLLRQQIIQQLRRLMIYNQNPPVASIVRSI